MPAAARILDMHTCPLINPGGVPHVGGPILPPGCATVLIGGLPAATLGDMCICAGPPDTIVKGSGTVKICGKPAARMGDTTAHGGSILGGLATVNIGG
ncbi:MAG: PAAR domain-containing protein [Maribacter sp.]